MVIGCIVGYLLLGLTIGSLLEALEPPETQVAPCDVALLTFLWPLGVCIVVGAGWMWLHKLLVKVWKKILKKD